jgi:hypothetical protein
MALWLCRWNDKFVSLVSARDKGAVYGVLDEVDDPSEVIIKRLRAADAMVTFEVSPSGELKLAPEDWQGSTIFDIAEFGSPAAGSAEDDEAD